MSYYQDNNHKKINEDYDTLEEKFAKRDLRLIKHPTAFRIGLLIAIGIVASMLIFME